MNWLSQTQYSKGSTEFWSNLWSEPLKHNTDEGEGEEKIRESAKIENVIITVKELVGL